MKKYKIIAFHGIRGSGKSTCADILDDLVSRCELGKYSQVLRTSFAEPGKAMLETLLCDHLMIPRAHFLKVMDDPVLKETHVFPIINKTLRDLMKSLLHGWGREQVGDTLWLDIFTVTCNSFPKHTVIVSDLRYENEAEIIRALGGLVVHIERPALKVDDSHPSEAGIEYWPSRGDVKFTNPEFKNREAAYDKLTPLLYKFFEDLV